MRTIKLLVCLHISIHYGLLPTSVHTAGFFMYMRVHNEVLCTQEYKPICCRSNGKILYLIGYSHYTLTYVLISLAYFNEWLS